MVNRFFGVAAPLEMPWYQPCATRGYSKFYDQGSGEPGTPTDPDRAVQYEVTDEYLNALERAFHQGQYDAGITNVEDTSAIVFDFLAENCITDTEAAYRLGKAQKDQDPGGSVDPNYLDPSVNRPGFVEPTPARQDMSTVYGTTATPEGQPAAPAGGGSAGWSPQPIGGTAGPSPMASSFTAGGGVSAGGGGVSAGLSFGKSGGINWLLIAAVAVGAYFLLKKG